MQKLALSLIALSLLLFYGCNSPSEHHERADATAAKIIEQKQGDALGRTEPFTIETPGDTLRRRLLLDQNLPVSHAASYGSSHIDRIEHYPKDAPGGEPLPATQPTTAPAQAILDPATSQPVVVPPVALTLVQALQISAHNSRDFQNQKEQVYLAALSLDLERDEFRTTFTGLVSGEIIRDLSNDPAVTAVSGGPEFGLSQRFKSGLAVSSRIGIDLARLLTGDKESATGIFMDVSASMPLLRGAGPHIVAEPLTQSERDVIYALWDFENFKRDFALQVTEQYFAVLEQLDNVRNADNNYRRLIQSTERTQALADAGRIVPVQVDQSINQELSARDRWITARESFGRRLDQLKTTLGLPPDAYITLDRGELRELNERADDLLIRLGRQPLSGIATTQETVARLEREPSAGYAADTLGLDEGQAIAVALDNRLDLRIAKGEVYDAQRRVAVSADALRAGLVLTGDASAGGRRSGGSAGADNADLRFDQGVYSAGAQLDLPLERTAERLAYRQSLINLNRTVRALQDLEDQIKLEVRNTLRDLLVAREGVQTQAQAVLVAERRRASAAALFEAGRQGVQIRDVLEAEDALIQAQNRFTATLVDHRLAELGFQRDVGVLEVNEEGLWKEYMAEAPVGSAPPLQEAAISQQEPPATQQETPEENQQDNQQENPER